jgi:peptidyl-prolyl cis-trans isomerase C
MISVNGVEIPEAAVLAEMQYHPASSREEAAAMAAEALVVRELLLERAAALGIAFHRGDETAEERAMEALLQRELKLPEPRDEDFERYYGNNKAQFRSPDLYEASHILYLAPRDDETARARGRELAARAIDRLMTRPESFSEIARAESACSSAGEGGRLGQVAAGETSPEIDTFLQSLADGQLCPVPVETDYGVQVLMLHRKIPGVTLSYEVALPVIQRRLRAHAWGMAVSQYISLLAGEADVKGIEIRQAMSPLVQ